MRGKLNGLKAAKAMGRLIPAHAGKTTADVIRNSLDRAHPRACGENGHKVCRAALRVGSSPRMRGKLSLPLDRIEPGGLIPAHAGKTRELQRELLDLSAHPRACGENSSIERERLMLRGSSPRMRGKRRLIIGGLITSRLIPAHAGKTPKASITST